jgi:hypothetical protein
MELRSEIATAIAISKQMIIIMRIVVEESPFFLRLFFGAEG